MFEKDDRDEDLDRYQYPDDRYEYERTSRRRRQNKKSNKSMIVMALIFSILGGIIGSAITNVLINDNNIANQNEGPKQKITINSNDKVNVATAVSKKAMPSVVGITTKGRVDYGFFGSVEASGTGSGIIVDNKGYILTNAHVVKLNDQVVNECSVIIDDGTELRGKPIWLDTGIDLAIVKIDPAGKELVAADLGNSDELQIGETAIAIGNPINIAFEKSVSQGIISGLDRYLGQVDGGGFMMGLIQTDASINGGNSGGPLLNAKGEVVGINTVKVASAEGMGFAIPINFVKPIIKQVIETGNYESPSLGILSVDVEGARRYLNQDIKVENGVFVIKVYDNSPAAAAGIEVGDVIVKIGDDDIDSTAKMKSVLYKYTKGDKVKVTIIRNGSKKETEVDFQDYSVEKDRQAQEDMMRGQERSQQQGGLENFGN
jgi:serine protease Do